MSDKTVFISYSHDSDEHRERVLALSERLRADGIETLLDQYVNGSPQQGWPRWMLDQLDAADSVLVVCTETYYRRFRGLEEPGKGKGVDWEGALITQELYDSRSRTLKFVPVFLSAAVENWIPEPLRAASHYALTEESAYQRLYDFLLEQAGVEPQPVGALKTKPRRKAIALTFDEPSPAEVATRDISRIDKYAPAELIGREAETKLLSDAWDQTVRGDTKRPHVITFVALGGEGKTSLVAKWAAGLSYQDWPGCEVVFAWSFLVRARASRRRSSSLDLCHASLQHAVDGLRRAGSQDHIPRGLLTRAWYFFAEAAKHRLLDQQQQAADCETSARRDLDEAWEIAKRGPMPLFMADIHLHRARLFFREKPYLWISPQADLAEARRLIEKHGYLRRMEELEDAEAVILAG